MLTLFRRSACHTAPSRADCLTVLEPTTLLGAHRGLLASIRSMVGVPAAHWHALYQPMMNAYANVVQSFPASEAHHHAGSGGLLRHGLEVAHEALKLRREALLPSGGSAEELARLQDVWTYACVSAALLHDIGKPMVDLRIASLDSAGRATGMWSAITGPMALGARYRVEFAPKRVYRRHERIAALLAHHVVPREGLLWLASEPEILGSWLAAIQGDIDEAAALGAIVAKADGLSVASDLAGGAMARMPTTRVKPLAERLLTTLRHLLAENIIPLNRRGAGGFLDGNVLWLVSKRGLDAVREQMLHEGQPGVPSRNDRLMDELQQYGLVIPNGDRAVWNCEVRIDTWSAQLTCLGFDAARLWPDPDRRPDPMQGTITALRASEESDENESMPRGVSELDSDSGPFTERPILDQIGNTAVNGVANSKASPSDAQPGSPLPAQVARAGVGGSEKGGADTGDADEEADAATTTGPTDTVSDAGVRFLDWLKRNINDNRVQINTPQARLHVLPEGLALVTPGIFRDFDPAGWQQAQKRFQKLRVHRKTAGNTNIWTCRVAKDRRQSLIKVFLIAQPETTLGVWLPGENAAVSLILEDSGSF